MLCLSVWKHWWDEKSSATDNQEVYLNFDFNLVVVKKIKNTFQDEGKTQDLQILIIGTIWIILEKKRFKIFSILDY